MERRLIAGPVWERVTRLERLFAPLKVVRRGLFVLFCGFNRNILTMNQADDPLRKQVLYLLRRGDAHLSFDDFISSFPADLCNRQIESLPYTPWQILEHMRISQWDILEFARDPNHVSPEFPKGYWPSTDELGSPALWQKTIDGFRKDLQQMEALLEDPSTDLHALIPHGDGQTILRQALLTADHNAYHLGVLTVMARILKAAPNG